jgi:hypothetical protein
MPTQVRACPLRGSGADGRSAAPGRPRLAPRGAPAGARRGVYGRPRPSVLTYTSSFLQLLGLGAIAD